jgi:ATP-dependent protease HslVU (ClpYQ) peptidase subunit
MTTIAYHHKLKSIAVDSRVSTHNFVCIDDAKKWFTYGEDKVLATGECADIYELERDWESDKFAPLKCEFMLIRDKKVFYGYIQNGRKRIEPLTYNFAIGSGKIWAMAAMDYGDNAEKSVEYAIKKDKTSGGKVQVFNT